MKTLELLAGERLLFSTIAVAARWVICRVKPRRVVGVKESTSRNSICLAHLPRSRNKQITDEFFMALIRLTARQEREHQQKSQHSHGLERAEWMKWVVHRDWEKRCLQLSYTSDG